MKPRFEHMTFSIRCKEFFCAFLKFIFSDARNGVKKALRFKTDPNSEKNNTLRNKTEGCIMALLVDARGCYSVAFQRPCRLQ